MCEVINPWNRESIWNPVALSVFYRKGFSLRLSFSTGWISWYSLVLGTLYYEGFFLQQARVEVSHKWLKFLAVSSNSRFPSSPSLWAAVFRLLLAKLDRNVLEMSLEALGCSQRCARHLTAEGCSTEWVLLAGILTAFIFLGATFQVFCSWAVSAAWTGSDVLAILWAIHLKTPLTALLAKISAWRTVLHRKIGKWVVNPDKKLGRRKTYWTAGKTETHLDNC